MEYLDSIANRLNNIKLLQIPTGTRENSGRRHGAGGQDEQVPTDLVLLVRIQDTGRPFDLEIFRQYYRMLDVIYYTKRRLLICSTLQQGGFHAKRRN
jgi:hypothetical protein